MAARPRWLPRPFELFTWGMTILVVLVLRWQGLRMDWRTVEFMAAPMLGRLPTALWLGLALQGAALVLRRDSLRPWLKAVVSPASAWLWLRLWLVAMAMTYAYSWLKVSIPLVRRSLFDEQLWSFDRVIHLGLSPSVFVAELVHGTPLAGLLDRWYGLWVTTVLAALAFVFLSPRWDERRNFALACGVLWLVGVWIYLAVPALGPCYASPDVFAHLTSEMPSARAGQGTLWSNYARMLAGRDGTLKQFNPYFGVAAFPSLHVGAHWLFALWARRRLRALFVPLAVATGLTFLASLATGWHYAVDGYAGMLLAWLAVRLADRFEPVEERPDGDQEPAEGGLDAGRDAALEPG
ncbi:MAG TPA: phosphatase PAP2 family protein, partial [Thermoanaerobaculia bacterium]|nr:phosphatase PAP2 family protein [Thermoanaerobaculia bacterium]